MGTDTTIRICLHLRQWIFLKVFNIMREQRKKKKTSTLKNGGKRKRRNGKDAKVGKKVKVGHASALSAVADESQEEQEEDADGDDNEEDMLGEANADAPGM